MSRRRKRLEEKLREGLCEWDDQAITLISFEKDNFIFMFNNIGNSIVHFQSIFNPTTPL
jgi:hypothetical protein